MTIFPDPPYDLVLTGATLANHDGVAVRDVAIKDGKIAAISTQNFSLANAPTKARRDLTGLTILPGVIDSQVHFREPGLTHKEDLESGSRAAVMGGVTCVFEMPNTTPLTTSAETLTDKLTRAHHRMHCDFAFWVGGTRENVAALSMLERLPGAAGIKVFMGASTGDLLVEDDESITRILSQTHRRAAFHSEDEFMLRAQMDRRVAGDPASHHIWRDAAAALSATQRLLNIAEKTRAKIHVLHISSAEELPLLARHRDLASVEMTPHHLTLTAEDYKRLGTLLQMNPPVREAHHRAALWHALNMGLTDVLGSDHAPHRGADARADYADPCS